MTTLPTPKKLKTEKESYLGLHENYLGDTTELSFHAFCEQFVARLHAGYLKKDVMNISRLRLTFRRLRFIIIKYEIYWIRYGNGLILI